MKKPKATRAAPHVAQPPQPRHAVYIAEMAAQLATIAERDGLPLAAYFLRMAHLEAASRARRDISG